MTEFRLDRRKAWMPLLVTCALAMAAQTRAMPDSLGGQDWPIHGMDNAGTRFSRLAQITSGNVDRLGLVWSYDLQSTRGVEATPIVVNGVMYVTAPWSIVHAIDVRTGERIWSFDPQVARRGAYRACCDVVNRGVAVSQGKVYVGTVDGRLIALDTRNGHELWQHDTVMDHSRSYTSTGAPRVYRDKVIIGNAGGEFGVRGYVTAYDAHTGRQAWRWFTVPGDPAKAYEDDSMAKAARTWDPSGKYWESGGGGTVWNSMAFDETLNLLYIGTDNGAPWSFHQRSPAGGDNLYLCSIVALNIDTGKYVWHYQETPGDSWDYGSTQDIILADLAIGGRDRKTILHAPKNGFFFVIDRTTGEFISAENFVDVNWTTGYGADGRPVVSPKVRASVQSYEIVPSPSGAHNWQSMSWNPDLELAYIPAQGAPIVVADDKRWTGYGSNVPGMPGSGVGWNLAMVIGPPPPLASKPFGRLIAWDPVRQRQRWSVEQAAPSNGGTLATAGNLVFQGSADGRFVAYDAATGEKRWESLTGTGILAAPVTYEIDGKQYVSIAVGWGGLFGLTTRATRWNSPGAVYTYALGGHAKPPPFVAYPLGDLLSGVKYQPADMAAGAALYVSNCFFCHGPPGVEKGGSIPNLGYVPAAVISNLDRMLFDGPFTDKGMPDFTGKLTHDDAEKIKAFIQGTADAVRSRDR